MPNFVSFMYFLLDSVADITANFWCKCLLWVSCIFWLSVEFYSRLANSSIALLKKFLATRQWNARSGRKHKSTFLFSLCQEETITWMYKQRGRDLSPGQLGNWPLLPLVNLIPSMGVVKFFSRNTVVLNINRRVLVYLSVSEVNNPLCESL